MSRSTIDQPQIWHTLRELAGAICCLAIVLAIRGTAIAEDSAKNLSTSAAWLHVGDPQSIDVQTGARNAAEYGQFRNTQAALLKCPLVLRAALEVPGIAELSLLKTEKKRQQWLEDHLRVTCPKDQELIMVDLPGEEAEQAAKIVNAVVKSYMDNIVQADHIKKLKQRLLVEDSYKECMEQLQKRRDMRDKVAKQFNAADMAEVKRDRSADLGRLLMDIRSRRLEVDLQAASAETRLAKAPSDSSDAAKAKLDLAIAEAQCKVLDKANDDVCRDLRTEVEKRTQTSQVLSLNEEILQLERNAAVREQELERLKLELSMPQRVVLLQDASAD